MQSLTDNIIARFETIDLADVNAGIAWYADAHDFAAELAAETGYSVAQCAGVIAATSPLKEWESNKALAALIIRAGGGITSGYFKVALLKCDAILAGADIEATLNGVKTRNFYNSIITRGQGGITIDRHAHDIAMGRPYSDAERGTISETLYATIADAYADAAAELESRGCLITPAELQSVTWVSWVAEFGGTRR